MKYLLLTIIALLAISCSNNNQSQNPTQPQPTGLAKVSVQVPPQIAAILAARGLLSIQANDMVTIRKTIAIDNITETPVPTGPARIFTLDLIDTNGHTQYTGADTANITSTPADISIPLYRVTAPVSISATIMEDSSSYQYYRFVANASTLAGPWESILTETHFIMAGIAYPKDTNFTIISYSPMVIGTITSLFNNNGTANTGYVKWTYTNTWEWIIDMKDNYTFDSFYMASWETFFYHEPSNVSIYGAHTQSGPWSLLGAQVFTSIYQNATIPLTY